MNNTSGACDYCFTGFGRYHEPGCPMEAVTMEVTLMEHDGRIALATPIGTLVLDGVMATRLATAMEECARWSVAKQAGDPDRDRILAFRLYKLIDPAPVPEQGGTAPPDMKGQPAVEPDPVSSGGGIDAGSGAGGGA